MMFFLSCKSNKVERINIYPEIDFPEFPKLKNFEIVDDKVLTDSNYFRELLIFKTEYEQMILEYEEKKNKLKEGEIK